MFKFWIYCPIKKIRVKKYKIYTKVNWKRQLKKKKPKK